MLNEVSGNHHKRVPSLVSLCQRVASANVESISSLGNGMPISLIRPILQNCPADVLARFELTSPEICSETPDVWKTLCFRTFPLTAEQHFAAQEPECWRNAYFRLRVFEKERLDAVAARLRVKREEERKRKEGTQIKFTDKLPPVKRSRGTGWGITTPPKTLFQKTRTHAAKLQKGIYAAHLNPSTPIFKTNRPLASTSSASSSASISPPPVPAIHSSGNATGTRVSVAVVPKAKAPSTTATPNSSRRLYPPGDCTISTSVRSNLPTMHPSPRGTITAPPPPRVSVYSSVSGKLRTVPPPTVGKDPTPSLLLSKPRGQVHISTHSNAVRSRA
ncbi:RNA polymerase II transcription factor SIII subunit A-domain-containing protein [Irpex lacteus]|nr:RNA polymerase II transcription factor SIII subunit A-domain-containing protein [Irpex lacteus]